MASDPTTVNFMGGSPLNRLSWLRNVQPFMQAIAQTPSTRWIVFKDGQPLLRTSTSAESAAEKAKAKAKAGLAPLPTSAILSLLGPGPLFGQAQQDGEVAPADVKSLEAARLRGPPVVFLGLDEPSEEGAEALPSSEFSGKEGDAQKIVDKVRGTPWFAVDVSEVEKEKVDEVLGKAKEGTAFVDARAALSRMSDFEAAMFAQARSMIDWNARNKFCPGCGSRVYSLWAGWKLACTSLLPWADNEGKPQCPSAKGLHNFAHPRSDPVVIMIALSPDREQILLGRNRKFPGKFYSALAGFIEPGEALEDAVRREMWEEAGVRVWDVQYHSGQPWPFPANLMVGFYATADPSKPVRLDLDTELADARWYTRAEILKILEHPLGTTLTRGPRAPLSSGSGALAHSDPSQEGAKETGRPEPSVAEKEEDEPEFKVPPVTAIAGVLIADWAYGRIGGGIKKGNL